MQYLEQKFNTDSVYFCVNRTNGLSTPYLLNDDYTRFVNLYTNEIIEVDKKFPFKFSSNAPIIKHNFSQKTLNNNSNISIHRLWYLKKHTKYFSSLSIVQKLMISKIINSGEISLRQIIQICNVINNSKRLKREFKKESSKPKNVENTL